MVIRLIVETRQSEQLGIAWNVAHLAMDATEHDIESYTMAEGTRTIVEILWMYIGLPWNNTQWNDITLVSYYLCPCRTPPCINHLRRSPSELSQPKNGARNNLIASALRKVTNSKALILAMCSVRAAALSGRHALPQRSKLAMLGLNWYRCWQDAEQRSSALPGMFGSHSS